MPNETRPTFRRRLVVATGTALGLSLTLLAVMIWLGAFAWLNNTARRALDAEAENVIASIVTPEGRLDVDAYSWNEPHHRFVGRHIDPFFLQVFDAQGNLLRASSNIDSLDGERYPARPLAASTARDDWYEPLRTFRIDGRRLYYAVRPLYNDAGERLGTLQVAREDPGIRALYGPVALVLLAGLIGTLAASIGLVGWIAGRVLRPLETITHATRTISAERLGQRVPLPDEADRETTQLATTLNTLLGRLERSFDEMQRFTASAAHELKTPLTALRGHVDVALRRPRSEADYRETLGLVRRKIDHLVGMVNGLLTLARLGQRSTDAPEETVDLAAIVRAEADAFSEQARVHDVAFCAAVPELVRVRGREALLREVVVNLLDNAVKYTPEGRIDVRLAVEDGTAVFTVADTGIGIDGDVLPHVTDRFYRAASVDTMHVEGSGLGLSLVEQIVMWHAGTLDIDSVSGEGTTVTVRIPAVRTASEEVPAAGRERVRST